MATHQREENPEEAFVAAGAERETLPRPPSDAGFASEDYYSRRAWKTRCVGCETMVPVGNYCVACGDALPGGSR